MLTSEQFHERIESLAADYVPSEEALAQTAGINLTVVMGPSSSGKSTLMRLSNRFIVISDTDRQPRLREKDGVAYHFKTPNDYDDVVEDAEKGDYVQIIQHPTTRNFYGSHISAYPQEGVALLDCLPSQYLEISTKQIFKTIQGVYVVRRTFDDWYESFYNRWGGNETDMQKRLLEARSSLESIVGEDSSLPDTQVLISGNRMAAGKELRWIAKGGKHSSSHESAGRRCAENMLKGIINII